MNQDFYDDGGTPMYRARMERQARIIEMERPGFLNWWRRTPMWVIAIYVLLAGFFIPWGVFIGGLLLNYLFDRLTGRWP